MFLFYTFTHQEAKNSTTFLIKTINFTAFRYEDFFEEDHSEKYLLFDEWNFFEEQSLNASIITDHNFPKNESIGKNELLERRKAIANIFVDTCEFIIKEANLNVTKNRDYLEEKARQVFNINLNFYKRLQLFGHFDGWKKEFDPYGRLLRHDLPNLDLIRFNELDDLLPFVSLNDITFQGLKNVHLNFDSCFLTNKKRMFI